MKIKPFALERYFAKYEFSVKFLLSSSDCDGLFQREVLEMADSETKRLWENLQLGYTESQGLPFLRQEIAKLYKGIDCNKHFRLGFGRENFPDALAKFEEYISGVKL